MFPDHYQSKPRAFPLDPVTDNDKEKASATFIGQDNLCFVPTLRSRLAFAVLVRRALDALNREEINETARALLNELDSNTVRRSM